MKYIYIILTSVFLVACSNNTETTNDNADKVENSSENELPTSKQVFDYAQSDFNSLTNSGENYIPEKHDELVIQHTADYFGLDYEKTDQLYMEEATGNKDATTFKSTVEKTTEKSIPEMDMAMFKVLKPDMTYDEIRAFTNLEGTINPSMSSQSKGITTYEFAGVGFSNTSLIFSYGELMAASQAGLIETPALSIEGYELVTDGMHVSDVFDLIGEGEYTGFSYSPNNGLQTSYTYKLNNSYISFHFFDDYLFGVPDLSES